MECLYLLLFAPAEIFTYIGVMVLSIVLEAVLVLASSFSFVALGVGTLLGPILISFIIVPWLRHWFFSWINFSVKFGMFAVVAAAQAFIWATAADNFINTFVAGNYSLAHMLTSIAGLGIITLGAVLGFSRLGRWLTISLAVLRMAAVASAYLVLSKLSSKGQKL